MIRTVEQVMFANIKTSFDLLTSVIKQSVEFCHQAVGYSYWVHFLLTCFQLLTSVFLFLLLLIVKIIWCLMKHVDLWINYCHNDFVLDLDDHKNKWSRHRSFLYGCDRSPGIHVLKLGTEILNLKQHDWSTELIWKF